MVVVVVVVGVVVVGVVVVGVVVVGAASNATDTSRWVPAAIGHVFGAPEQALPIRQGPA